MCVCSELAVVKPADWHSIRGTVVLMLSVMLLAHHSGTDAKATASYLVKITFIVALMQCTADAQDSCSALALKAQPWRVNGSKNGWRHAVSNFTCCVYPQQLDAVSFNLRIQMSSLMYGV